MWYMRLSVAPVEFIAKVWRGCGTRVSAVLLGKAWHRVAVALDMSYTLEENC